MRSPAKRVAATAVCLALTAGLTACSDEPETPATKSDSAPEKTQAKRLFAPSSVWNRALPADTPLDPQSRAYAGELRRQVAIGDPYINVNEFSTPVYEVPEDQRRVRVQLDTNYSSLQRAFESVPIPDGATPAKGTDGHMVVWQPGTDTMWEFFKAVRRPDGWHARWGAKLDRVSRHPGYIPQPTGATATGLPLAAGLITVDELRRDRIDHALALAIPEAATKKFVFPAQRTDGKRPNPGSIPEGTQFRLDPKVDVDALNLPRPVGAMAKAAQRYGIIVRDQSGVVVFYGEDPRSGEARGVYGKTLGGQNPASLLRSFPWDKLQAVKPAQPGN